MFLLVSCMPNHFESKIEHLGFAFCETLGPLENVSGCCHLAYWFCLALPASRLCVTCNGQWIRHHLCFLSPCVTCAHYLRIGVLLQQRFVIVQFSRICGLSPPHAQSRVSRGVPLSSLLSMVLPYPLLFFCQEYWISLGNFSSSSCCSLVSQVWVILRTKPGDEE